jgi:hypothetical protein
MPAYPFHHTDDDGDALEIHEVGGFGQPMLVIAVTQDGERNAVNYPVRKLRHLINALKDFEEPSYSTEQEQADAARPSEANHEISATDEQR